MPDNKLYKDPLDLLRNSGWKVENKLSPKHIASMVDNLLGNAPSTLLGKLAGNQYPEGQRAALQNVTQGVTQVSDLLDKPRQGVWALATGGKYSGVSDWDRKGKAPLAGMALEGLTDPLNYTPVTAVVPMATKFLRKAKVFDELVRLLDAKKVMDFGRARAGARTESGVDLYNALVRPTPAKDYLDASTVYADRALPQVDAGQKAFTAYTNAGQTFEKALSKTGLPPVLYHVTVNEPEVMKSGVLKGKNLPLKGLVGYHDAGVSFTSDRDTARLIREELTRAANISKGEGDVRGASYLRGLVERDITLDPNANADGLRATMERIIKEKGFDLFDEQKIPPKWTWEAYKQYLFFRGKHSEKLFDPVMLGSVDDYAKLDPKNISILAIPSQEIPNNALVQEGVDHFNKEIRVRSEVPVEKAKSFKKSK